MINILKSQVPEKIGFMSGIARREVHLDTEWLRCWARNENYSDELIAGYGRVCNFLRLKADETLLYVEERYGKLQSDSQGIALLSYEFNRIAFGDEDTWSVVWDLVNNKRDVNGDMK